MSAGARTGGGPSLPLVLLCAALGLVVYLEQQENGVLERVLFERDSKPAQSLPETPTVDEDAPPARRVDQALPAAEDFAEISARPLFNPTRRPIEPPLEPILQKIVQPSQFTLIGILISDGEKLALIRRTRTNDYVRVYVGQEIDGWRVESIVPDRIVIRQGESTEELVLKDLSDPKPPSKRRPRKKATPKTRVPSSN